MSKKFREATVTITGISPDGHGLGELPSATLVEVPFTAPGDEVRITFRSKKKGRYQARAEELIKASSLRAPARCSHFASCGGCRWQHLPYETQLEMKQDRVRALFSNWEGNISPIVPCDPPWHYRNKMEFSFSHNTAGELFLGLYMSRGRVCNLTECHLVNPWFMEALEAARAWTVAEELQAYYPPADRGSLRTLTVREGMRSGDRMVILTISGNPDYAVSSAKLQSFVKAMSPIAPNIFVQVQQIAKGRPTQFFELHLNGKDTIQEELHVCGPSGTTHRLKFNISPSAFFQPNTFQAEKLYSRALSMVSVHSEMTVFDLYAGTGTLGICLAKEVKEVLSIELSPEAALDARSNAEVNEIENIHIVTGDVGKVLTARRESADFQAPDLVVLDPPRAGLDKTALDLLCSLKPEQILYISCNPNTQAENVAVLIDAGYEITGIQAVDQFPQTVHTENIVALRQKS